MKIEIKGLKEVQEKFTALKNNAEALNGSHNVPLQEILSPVFLASCSNYRTPEEFFGASGFKIGSKADFDAIPQVDWDLFVSKSTRYSNWDDMIKDGMKQYVIGKLGL